MAQFLPVYTYFGRIPLRLDPEPPDPMTVLVVERFAFRRAGNIAARLLTGRGLEAVRGFQVWPRVKQLEVEADPPVLVQADGELLGRAERLVVSHQPEALQVVVPSPAGSRRGAGSP